MEQNNTSSKEIVLNLNDLCSDSIMQSQKLQQPHFYTEGHLLCKPCAEYCQKDAKFSRCPNDESRLFKFKFSCQCRQMGGCKLQLLDDEAYTTIISKQPGNDIATLQVKYETNMAEILFEKLSKTVARNMIKEQQFNFRIESEMEMAYLHHDEITKVIALSCVPDAIQYMTYSKEQIKALLKWFKNDFFKWMDRPLCPNCNTWDKMERWGDATPTNEDREFNATKIESYTCKDCKATVKFPRYNHPVKLFETQVGRSSEWANCFTAICVALGYPSRKTFDWTDHAWTEIWLEDRWMHVDPSEESLDQPMLYEKGWDNDITYVLAFSNEEVLDVSKRYAVDENYNRIGRD